eukprot:845274_1
MGSAVSNINFKSRTTTVKRSAISNSTSRTTTTTVERSAVSNSTSRTITTKVERLFATCSITERFLREIRMLRLLSSHENIIELIDIVPPRSALKFDTLCVVYEYMPSNLKHIRLSNQYLRNSQIEYIMYQILLGVKHIHSAAVIHLDLKPQNILLDGRCKIRISDFQSARTVSEYAERIKDLNQYQYHKPIKPLQPRVDHSFQPKLKLVRRHHVSPWHRMTTSKWYLAPEAILRNRDKRHLYAIDIWSVGCIFAELLQMSHINCTDYKQRHVLFKGNSCFPYCVDRHYTNRRGPSQLQTIVDVIGTAQITDIIDGFDCNVQTYLHNLRPSDAADMSQLFPATNESGIALLSKMLAFDPRKRITVRNALRSEYFDGVRDTYAEHRHLHFEICKRVYFVQVWMRHNNINPRPSQSYRDVCEVISQFVQCDELIFNVADIREPVMKDELTLRAHILDEIIYFNPQWKKQLMRQHKRKRKELRKLRRNR